MTRVRCKKREPAYDTPAAWWPPGPEGVHHPLAGNFQPESVRSRSEPAKAAGRARHFSFKPTPRGKRCDPKSFTISDLCSEVPMGKSIHRTDAEVPSSFKGAAGLLKRESASPSRRMGYGEGRPEDADPKNQRAYRGAAGADVKKGHAVKRTAFHKEASERNFHTGLHTEESDPLGVYSFKVSAVSRKARSVPKRKSNVGALIYGGNLQAVDFKGDEETFRGSAGSRRTLAT
eukprot:CAMPEP_0115504470 /NCGR_PEP_ID=MMETSP0271-20121206/70032_1 /TAXON_ID=71861 /ORGANISM="Scrippsiella trochoidea, Strain CCMP3099" /LENGTH=231 /DNA_ID=CAMNT_0002933641 /DNA_START=134 /DNA_END=825 /DNA_ORIENTATION=+